MPVSSLAERSMHNYTPGNPPGGQKHRGRFQTLAPRQLAHTENNALVLRAADARASPEELVPQGEHSAAIGVSLGGRDRVMDAVEVACNQHGLQPALQAFGQPD